MLRFLSRRGPAQRPFPPSRKFRFTARPLADLAEEVGGFAELLGRPPDIAFVHLSEPVRQVLRPAFLLGEGADTILAHREGATPPGRIYRFTGETHLYGKGLLMRGETLVRLDPLDFPELGRFDYPYHAHIMSGDGNEVVIDIADAIRDVEEPCLLLAQCGEFIWGHWLVDLMPRLGLGLACPADLHIVLDANAPPWALPMLARAGIGPDRIVWHDAGREVLRFRDLYLPTFLRRGNLFSPLANLGWRPLQAGAPKGELDLYVSRARIKAGSSLVNHREIEAAAERRGYRIVHPETMGLERQIALFSHGRRVVGEYGSALHNTVFSPAGTRVGVLQSPKFPWFVQCGIGQVRAQPTGVAFGVSAGPEDRRFHMPPDLFGTVLDRLEAGI